MSSDTNSPIDWSVFVENTDMANIVSYVFHFIASSDGSISKNEIDSFYGIIKQSAIYDFLGKESFSLYFQTCSNTFLTDYDKALSQLEGLLKQVSNNPDKTRFLVELAKVVMFADDSLKLREKDALGFLYQHLNVN